MLMEEWKITQTRVGLYHHYHYYYYYFNVVIEGPVISIPDVIL